VPAKTAYRHWSLEELWRFRDEVFSYANDQLIQAMILENAGQQRLAANARDQLAPLLDIMKAYQDKARITQGE
jgi:hypothetical protein